MVRTKKRVHVIWCEPNISVDANKKRRQICARCEVVQEIWRAIALMSYYRNEHNIHEHILRAMIKSAEIYLFECNQT
jgi:hypothetical protein